MKGIVFTTFIEMVEQRFSIEIADRIITDAQLASGGIYTSVGTYDHREMIGLVEQLSKHAGIPQSDLIRVFGEYLFEHLVDMHPQFVGSKDTLFEFLPKVDSYIHVEVRKLYPDAELPAFEFDTSDPGKFIMIYRSSRPFADLAEGLIVGSIRHYGENIEVVREDLPEAEGTAARFILTKPEAAR